MRPQTFPDPEIDRRNGYKETPEALLYAVELTMGVLNVTKATKWSDLMGVGGPGSTNPSAEVSLADAGVVLSREQRGILLEHAAVLSYIRRAVTKTKDREGRKKLAVCVCTAEGCSGWALYSQGSPGPCPIDGSKLAAPKALVPSATAQKKAAVKKSAAKKAPLDGPGPGAVAEQDGLFDSKDDDPAESRSYMEPDRPDITDQEFEPVDVTDDDLPLYAPEWVPLADYEGDPGYLAGDDDQW